MSGDRGGMETSRNVIQALLDPSEKLLWSGQPRTGIVLRSVESFMIPVTLCQGGGLIVAASAAIYTPVWLFSSIIAISLLLIGLYLIFGRFIVDVKRRDKTYYGVTNERIIIVSGLFNRQIQSLHLRTWKTLSLDQKFDGSGTITFCPINEMNPSHLPGHYELLGGLGMTPRSFEMIQDANSVYNLIRTAQQQAS